MPYDYGELKNTSRSQSMAPEELFETTCIFKNLERPSLLVTVEHCCMVQKKRNILWKNKDKIYGLTPTNT
jgi:hypothetical protein